MNRRESIQSVLGLSSVVGLAALGAGMPGRAHALAGNAGDFASSYAQIPERYAATTVRFDRALPDRLSGTLFRNGPARMVRGDTRYHHWFDGDGMIQAFRFSGQSLRHQGRMVATRKLSAEADAGRFLWSAFGTSFADSRSVRQPDDINSANISVLPVQDEVLALWEGGSAWRIDPSTLETKGRRVFSPSTDGLPFSAHPKVDPSGTIWNFGYMSGSGKLVLYELTAAGSLKRARLIDAPNAEMVHDFAITERYLVFVLMPLRYDRRPGRGGSSFMDRFQWDAEGHVDILLVDKNSLTVAHRFEVAPFFAFHFGNAWEDGETVRIEVARAAAFKPLMNVITQATRGEPVDPISRPPLMELSLNLSGKTASANDLPVSGVDFPRFDQRFTGRKTSHLFMMSDANPEPDITFGFNQLVSLDRRSQRVRRWSYAPRIIAEEHLFVPDQAKGEANGWVVGTTFDPENRTTSLHVFNARGIDDGPIATATLPVHLPLGLHGQFVAG